MSARRIAVALDAIAALALLTLLLLINSDIASRNLFDAPIRGVTEIASLAVPVMLFCAIPGLVARGELIQSETLLGIIARHCVVGARGLHVGFFVAGGCLLIGVALAAIPNFMRALSIA
ncbi:MAG: hypothetical protein AAF384_01060, partial [Pseudomonadota bacterium]